MSNEKKKQANLSYFGNYTEKCPLRIWKRYIASVGVTPRIFPHIYNSTKTGRAGIVCSSVMVVPHMTFMHSEYP